MSTLTIAGLKKSFESKTVIHHVSLEVNSGEIVGLLGPNGAGKTTTFYMIVGLIKSDEGNIQINDKNICGTAQRCGTKERSTIFYNYFLQLFLQYFLHLFLQP